MSKTKTTTLAPLPDVDESALRERISNTLTTLATNDNIAEFYDEIAGQVALRRAQLEYELIFEINFLKAVEAHFEKLMSNPDAPSKRLPSSDFDITLEQKEDKVYEAEPLYRDLSATLPEAEFADACFAKTVYETNGTKLNKLARDYGENSPVGLAIAKHRSIKYGKAKVSIKRKDKAEKLVR